MQISEAAQLIKPALNHSKKSQSWVDLGCGSGTFTQALATLLPGGSKIFAVDNSAQQIHAFPNVAVQFIKANFEKEILPFQNLDGILMANALHFVNDKISLIGRLKKYLHKDGFFIIVEYDTNSANPWVPYPVSFSRLAQLFNSAGYTSVEKIGERSSIYNAAKMYAACIKN